MSSDLDGTLADGYVVGPRVARRGTAFRAVGVMPESLGVDKRQVAVIDVQHCPVRRGRDIGSP